MKVLAEKMPSDAMEPLALKMIPIAMPLYKDNRDSLKLYNDSMFRAFLTKVSFVCMFTITINVVTSFFTVYKTTL